MASYLSHFQSIKSSFDHVVIAVEDVSDLWPSVKDGFEGRLPFKRACLNNKTRNSVFLENFAAEYILTTDARIRSRFSQEQSIFWFREPYATLVLVACEDLEEFKSILKPRLKLIVQNDEKEWFIVYVSKAYPHNDNATKMAKKVFNRIEVSFNTKKRERCCKLDLHAIEESFWDDLESKVVECIRNTLDKRLQFYEDELRKLSEQRFMPVWNFSNFFILKESLAFMFEMVSLYEDALREYDELELCYLETVSVSGKVREFGGLDRGDDQAALLDGGNKQLTQFIQNDSFREFEFRQYLFSCQAKLLFKLNRPFEVAARGYSFIVSFSQVLTAHENSLPFCLREVWVMTACLSLINACTAGYKIELIGPDVEKQFHRLLGDIYSMCRIKFMRLAFLVGYGKDIERSPVNSAMLSLLPWPKPAIWPLLPPDASTEVLAKEKIILQATQRVKHFGIQSKPLPLEPSVLLREANRRRASLSAGNVFELSDGRPNLVGGIATDSTLRVSPSLIPTAATMSRTYSSPGSFENSLDRPMRLAEIHVAAEHALRSTISDENLWNSFSSVEEFEKKYLELTKGASENYHRSWWKRHGVVLDGETAAVCFRHGKFDLAANLYEKVCALYAGEGWQELLADVLPNLAECQNKLDDRAGYLLSCIRLLSLDKNLFLVKERQAFQAEIVRLAHSEMKDPVPLDFSSLITFSGTGGPLSLCDGDSDMLSVTVWSGFPDELTLDSLNLTLVDTFNTDEGAKGLRSSSAITLAPGRNGITLSVPPQKPGSYVLGVLTGQIGHLKVRSHSFSKGSPADSEDFMTYEKPVRPILKVFKPRPLVDLSAACTSPLLMNETQWVGISVRPIDYSLGPAVLCINTGPGLKIEESSMIEMESSDVSSPNASCNFNVNAIGSQEQSKCCEQLKVCAGEVAFPEWASDRNSILWIPVRAFSESISRGSSSVAPQRQSMVDGMRTIALKLKFGKSQHQIFERTLAVHFTDPFHVSTRIMDKCDGGFMLLQVILHSQVRATLTIYDTWLELQAGFVFPSQDEGRPVSCLFPLVVSPTSKVGVFFTISATNEISQDSIERLKSESILNIRYGISANRSIGAHLPVSVDSGEVIAKNDLVFKSILVLQKPILHPWLAVGFLPLPADLLRVGKLITMKWQIEKLKSTEEEDISLRKEPVLYEINASTDNWMIAGRKRGHASLSADQGSRIVISIICMPLVAGYVRPPRLVLPEVDASIISCNPPSPHLVCVMPAPLSSSFCIPA